MGPLGPHKWVYGGPLGPLGTPLFQGKQFSGRTFFIFLSFSRWGTTFQTLGCRQDLGSGTGVGDHFPDLRVLSGFGLFPSSVDSPGGGNPEKLNFWSEIRSGGMEKLNSKSDFGLFPGQALSRPGLVQARKMQFFEKWFSGNCFSGKTRGLRGPRGPRGPP